MVYWNMEPYIGLWLSASSFLPCHSEAELKNISDKLYPSLPSGWQAMRRTNTWDIKKYLEWNYIDEKEVQSLNESDLLIEEFFLRLRTHEWIPNISKYIPLLVPTYESLLKTYTKEWLIEFDGTKLRLTDEWMNVYNSIITDLLQKL
jgi:coproporphyrinogen III oxidase-like Fe-S oxidoreductase